MKKLLLSALLVLSPYAVADDWQLNAKESVLNFASTKNAAVTELHSFQTISGELVGDKAKLTIDLASVETLVPIRNDRMKEHLFEIVKYPQATVQINLDPKVLESLESPGSMADMPVVAAVDMHGIKKDITAKLRVIKLSDSKMLASTLEPILLLPADFSMQAGVNKLMEIAKLTSISSAVPVTFSLVFEEK
jgi:polyisoprenoid-binding protein YceI